MTDAARLIEDIRQLFQQVGKEALFTAEILAGLAALEGQPWRDLTARRLGALLGSHGIHPGPIRRGKGVRQGYRRHRVLPPPETANEPLHANGDMATENMEGANASAAAAGAGGEAGERIAAFAHDSRNDQLAAPPGPPPVAEQWRQRFLEQVAGVLLRNPTLSQPDAMTIAFQTVVEAWIRRPSPQTDPTRCAQCGQPGGLIAFKPLDGQSGATWLHGVCWSDWHQKREAQAISVLAEYGVSRDGLTGRREAPNGASAAATEENDQPSGESSSSVVCRDS
jgi:hypothetical protein